MASGKTHELMTIVSAFPTGMWLFMESGLAAGASAFVGCMAGVWLSPDLDVDGMTLSKRRMIQIPYIGKVVRWYWQPYSLAIAHRSFWSHFPVVGTLIRVLYGFWWLVVIVLHYELGSVLKWFVIGLMVADTVHFVTDVITSRFKRFMRRVGRGNGFIKRIVDAL